MQWLAEICVKRPIFAAVLNLVILVVGLAFYQKLGVDQFPKVDLPVVMVITRLPGASPEDIETEVTDKIENAVNTVGGIDELRSISSEGFSSVVVMFVIEKNIDVAAQEIRDRISTAMVDLPRGIEAPIVQKLDPDATPIIYVALQAPGKDPREVTEVADQKVRRRFESVDGVGQVRIVGGRARQINVWVDPVKLRALGVSAPEVAGAIGAQNITLPGGRVDTSRDYLTLRVIGRVESVDALRRIVVRDAGGRTIRVEDVANVEDGTEEVQTSALWNGERTVVLAMRKQSGANTVQVVDNILERMKEVQPELPPGYTLEVQRDNSGSIRTSVSNVKEHLALGALFAALIVLFFLGSLRSTVIAAVAIPTSIIGTFALMYLQGYTLNNVTLLALALAVGIVIDDAIVVLENIFRQVEEHHLQPMEAAIAGTKEIGLAVLATTLSLMAVFLPVAFLGGIPGRFLSSFGVTMAFSIGVSLFVSFTLTPMLASRWLKHHKPGEVVKKTVLERIVDVFYRPIERAYGGILGFCMRHRWVVVLASIGALVAMGPLAKGAKKGFIPIDDKAQFEVTVRLPEGRSVAATEVVGERIAREIRGLENVQATMLTIGDDEARTPNVARIYVKLTPPDQRAMSQDQMKGVVREKVLPHQPKDLRIGVNDVADFGGGSGMSTARIQYSLSGPDLKGLEKYATDVVEKMKQVPGAVDVDNSLVVGKPELGVYIDRDKAADLGVQVSDVAQAMNLLVGGAKVSSYSENGEEYDVFLRSSPEFRTDQDKLQLLTVPSRKLGQVALADLVKIRPGSGPSVINRLNRERTVTLFANAAPGYSEGGIGDAMVKAMEDENMPRGFAFRGAGQTKIMKQTGLAFVLGLLGAMVFMYLILAAQFESWLHPVTILISLPLTLPFAIASVVIFGQAIDMFSLLGIFVLFGVVKKNAILQIDHTNQLRAKGLPRLEAIMQANKDRLRPILMTTLAFVAGMIPLVTARGIGAGMSRAIAGVVVGGQSLSLLLTLVAVPVAYSFFDDASNLLRRLFSRRKPVEESPGGAPVAATPMAPEVGE